MKSLKFALYTCAFLLLQSCASEYSQRLSEAKVLQEKLNQTIENQESLGRFAKEEIDELNQMIDFHAKISGNEELFIKELRGDESIN